MARKRIKDFAYFRTPKGECQICGALAYGYHHIVPKVTGGTENEANKVLLCERCHNIAEDQADNGVDLSPHAMHLIKLCLD